METTTQTHKVLASTRVSEDRGAYELQRHSDSTPATKRMLAECLNAGSFEVAESLLGWAPYTHAIRPRRLDSFHPLYGWWFVKLAPQTLA